MYLRLLRRGIASADMRNSSIVKAIHSGDDATLSGATADAADGVAAE